MSTETNKAIVRRYVQVWKEGSLDLYEEFVAADVVVHGVPEGSGLEGLKDGYATTINAFPDFQVTVDDMIAEDDKVVFRWTFSGTHQGEFMGIPVTGKQVTYSGVIIYRLANARIVEVWFFPDNLSLMQQLGAIPTPETA